MTTEADPQRRAARLPRGLWSVEHRDFRCLTCGRYGGARGPRMYRLHAARRVGGKLRAFTGTWCVDCVEQMAQDDEASPARSP